MLSISFTIGTNLLKMMCKDCSFSNYIFSFISPSFFHEKMTSTFFFSKLLQFSFYSWLTWSYEFSAISLYIFDSFWKMFNFDFIVIFFNALPIIWNKGFYEFLSSNFDKVLNIYSERLRTLRLTYE